VRRLANLGRVVLVALAASGGEPVLLQAQVVQAELAQQLLVPDRTLRTQAVRDARSIPPDSLVPAVRAALIQFLDEENALREARFDAAMRGEILDPIEDDLYGSVAEIVVSMRDPDAIPALVGALGTGNLVIQAVARFGSHAAAHVLQAVTDRESPPYRVSDGLIALRCMVEESGGPSLSSGELRAVGIAASMRLEDPSGSPVTLRVAVDLALSLEDADLRGTVVALASDGDAVRRRGVEDPDLVSWIQRAAHDRISGVPALPECG